MPEDFEDARPDLLPSVQARSHYELFSLDAQLQGLKEAKRPYQIFAEYFAANVVYDLPEAMTHITQEQLDKWGVSFYEAMEAARENLARLQFSFIGPGEGDGLWCAMTKDSYDAARILLLDVIRGFRVRGDIVAMIPNREKLLVTGADDLHGLKGMLKLAADAIQQPRRISGIALRLDGNDWVPWLPDAPHPLFREFQQHQIQSFGQAYAEQKELLDKWHVKTGGDIFVATFSAIQRPDGRVLSWAAWAAGVTDAMLPKTDALMIGRSGGKPAMVLWEKAMDVAGDLMEPMDIYPPRYRVREFPSEKQLAAMGNMLK